MSDDWDFWTLRVDDEPASIFVDLGIAKEAPVRRFSRMAYLRLHMRRPRPDGLSSQEEFNDLIAVEDAVVAKVTENAVGLYVGRNTSSGNRDLYFYVADEGRFERDAKSALSAFPDYDFFTGSREDADWKTYFAFLHPSPIAMQQILNRRVAEQLRKHGDNLSVPRNIDHGVYLPSAGALEAFVEYVEGQGFKVATLPSEAESGGQFFLEFTRADRPSEIDEVVLPLHAKAAEFGGVYDGWGCNVAPGAGN